MKEFTVNNENENTITFDLKPTFIFETFDDFAKVFKDKTLCRLESMGKSMSIA